MARDRIPEAQREVMREWLRGAIRMSGLSPSGLAKKAGVAQTTVTRFLANSVDYAPGWSTIGKLAAAANVEPISPNAITVRMRGPISRTTPVLLGEPPADPDLTSDEYLSYLLSFRRVIDNLYVRVSHGSYKYPEVAESNAEGLAAVSRLDGWLYTLYTKYSPNRAAQPPASTSSGDGAATDAKQQLRARRGKAGRRPKTEGSRQGQDTYA
jgi:hypothetical protein